MIQTLWPEKEYRTNFQGLSVGARLKVMLVRYHTLNEDRAWKKPDENNFSDIIAVFCESHR